MGQEYTSVGFDKELLALLDTIHDEDQNYRLKLGEIEKEFGRDSEELKAHWEMIHDMDEENLIKVMGILDGRGWLGPDVIGEQGNLTLFLVIQHANIDTQLKYLPMLRRAVKEGNAQPDQPLSIWPVTPTGDFHRSKKMYPLIMFSGIDPSRF